jgi:hypothetical protein
VLACAGDIPTLETLAAASILRAELPELRVRVVNVVDLMRLLPDSEHPHGLPDLAFDTLFTKDRPVIFAFHGYPWLVHRLTYRRRNHAQLDVRGFKERGTTTTAFDMVMLNDLDRYHLVMDVIDRVPGLGPAPPHCGSGWPTPACGRGPGPASTARTCRRSQRGPGRAELVTKNRWCHRRGWRSGTTGIRWVASRSGQTSGSGAQTAGSSSRRPSPHP